MNEFFTYILKNSNVRILIYNGDVDLVCNFLGDQWFVERQVAADNTLPVTNARSAWTFRNQIAGWVKQFQRLDLLTVKGAGHFVPTDRAGPGLQMIYNFIKSAPNYSTPTGLDVTPKPLNAPATETPTPTPSNAWRHCWSGVLAVVCYLFLSVFH